MKAAEAPSSCSCGFGGFGFDVGGLGFWRIFHLAFAAVVSAWMGRAAW